MRKLLLSLAFVVVFTGLSSNMLLAQIGGPPDPPPPPPEDILLKVKADGWGFDASLEFARAESFIDAYGQLGENLDEVLNNLPAGWAVKSVDRSPFYFNWFTEVQGPAGWAVGCDCWAFVVIEYVGP